VDSVPPPPFSPPLLPPFLTLPAGPPFSDFPLFFSSLFRVNLSKSGRLPSYFVSRAFLFLQSFACDLWSPENPVDWFCTRFKKVKNGSGLYRFVPFPPLPPFPTPLLVQSPREPSIFSPFFPLPRVKWSRTIEIHVFMSPSLFSLPEATSMTIPHHPRFFLFQPFLKAIYEEKRLILQQRKPSFFFRTCIVQNAIFFPPRHKGRNKTFICKIRGFSFPFSPFFRCSAVAPPLTFPSPFPRHFRRGIKRFCWRVSGILLFFPSSAAQNRHFEGSGALLWTSPPPFPSPPPLLVPHRSEPNNLSAFSFPLMSWWAGATQLCPLDLPSPPA